MKALAARVGKFVACALLCLWAGVLFAQSRPLDSVSGLTTLAPQLRRVNIDDPAGDASAKVIWASVG